MDKVSEISSVLAAYRQYMSWVVVFSYFAVYGLLYPRYGRATWRVFAPTASRVWPRLRFWAVSERVCSCFTCWR